MDFLIRIKQNKSAMREIRKLPMEELDVDISFPLTTTQKKSNKENGYIFIQTSKNSQKTYSPKTRMRRWNFQSPYNMTLRIVRVQLKTIFDEKNIYQSVATIVLLENLLDRIRQLEKQVLLLSGQGTSERKRKSYYYEDMELTDELLVEYIDGGAFTIYELEKIVGAKKNVLRGRYNRAKKQIQAEKCQNNK